MPYLKPNIREEYLKQSVMSASSAELIVMLFDGCIKNLKLAEINLNEKKNLSETNNYLQKAQKIINELINCLDMSYELSCELLKIYEYLLYEIRMMNTRKDMSGLPGILELLQSCRETWQTVARTHRDSLKVNFG